mmetsp:Transcript_10029/g.16468  ORF Transcript_10029/g.16468 Transcript_10029/m.16468 type:complete len:87 (+) Transcript_10029:40-300(+)
MAARGSSMAPAQIMKARQEMEAVTDMYNRMVDTCWKKCIAPKYSDSELNTGEVTCVDRCVVKYVETNQKVGTILQAGMPGMSAAVR